MESFLEKHNAYSAFIQAELSRSLPNGQTSEKVLEAMKYSLLSGGKRLRGILVLACCDLVSGNFLTAAPAAVSVEMLHAYSLIHDDLPCMDNDSLRRGKPSCHIAFGEATAMLAGDALLTLSFETLTSIQDSGVSKKCVSLLSKAAGYRGMIRGQELDLSAEGVSILPVEKLDEIHSHKTGALFRASAAMGAVIGNGTPDEVEAVSRYAEKIGLSFQIIDDILDATSDDKTLGKTANSDESEQKCTYFSAYGLERSKEAACSLTREAVDIAARCFNKKARFIQRFAEDLLTRIN